MGHVVAEQVCGDRGNVFMYSSARSTAGESVWARGSASRRVGGKGAGAALGVNKGCTEVGRRT